MRYPEDNDQWAQLKGLKRWCPEHNIFFDTRTGCPACLKQQRQADKEAREKAREAKNKTWEENAVKVVWPGNKPPELGRKKRKWWPF